MFNKALITIVFILSNFGYSFCQNSILTGDKNLNSIADSISVSWVSMQENSNWREANKALTIALNRFGNKKFDIIDALIEKLASAPDCIGKGRLLICLNNTLRRDNFGFKSVDLTNEAILIAKKLQNSRLIVHASRAKAYSLKAINATDHEALSLFLDALAIQKKIGEKGLEIRLLKDIADHHYKYGDENRAISYYEEIIKEGGEFVGPGTIIDCWNAIGLINRRNGVYDTAIAYFEKGIEIATSQNSKVWVGLLKGNIGDTYFIQKKYDEAIPLLEVDLATSIEYSVTENLSKVCKTLGEIYLIKDQLVKAEDYLIKSIREGRANKQYAIVADSYNLLAEVRARRGNTEISMEYYRKSIHLKDSLKSVTSIKEKQLAEIDRIYDIRSREKYEQQLQKVNTEQSIVIEKQKIWNITIALVVIIISIISIAFYIIIRKRKKVTEKLIQQYSTILDQKEEIEKFNEKLEGEVVKRTKELMTINRELEEYAFMNAHTVRGPLARILGLFHLLENNLHNKGEEEEIIQKAIFEAKTIDKVLHEISKKLETH